MKFVMVKLQMGMAIVQPLVTGMFQIGETVLVCTPSSNPGTYNLSPQFGRCDGGRTGVMYMVFMDHSIISKATMR